MVKDEEVKVYRAHGQLSDCLSQYRALPERYNASDADMAWLSSSSNRR
jgi:hypothetical protein